MDTQYSENEEEDADNNEEHRAQKLLDTLFKIGYDFTTPSKVTYEGI